MAYQYIETVDLATEKVKIQIADVKVQAEVLFDIQTKKQMRLLFQYEFGYKAQTLLEEEYEYPCENERVVFAIRHIRDTFLDEGEAIMERKFKKSASGLLVDISDNPEPVALLLSDSLSDDELIPFTMRDVHEVIRYSLFEGSLRVKRALAQKMVAN